jgi:SAP domain
MAPKRKVTLKTIIVPTLDWESMTVVQLKSELEVRKLDVKGKKADLIKRLEDANADGGVDADGKGNCLNETTVLVDLKVFESLFIGSRSCD